MLEQESPMPPMHQPEAFQQPPAGAQDRIFNQTDMFDLPPVEAWMAHADAMLDAGEDSLTYVRPGSEAPEHATLVDAVNKNDGYGSDGNKISVPTAVIKHADGTIEEVPVADLMAWQQGGQSETESPTPEAEQGGRLEQIFAPVVPAEEAPKEFDFSSLLDPNFDNSGATVEGAAVRAVEGREQVDDWTREGAAHYLDSVLQRDLTVRDLIAQHAQAAGVDMGDRLGVVDFLRQNPAVRLELGKLFLGRVDRLANSGDVGDRIVKNEEKSPPYPGYVGKMKSRQYAALLALSMIDGTYDNRKEKESEGLQLDANGKVIRAQHRDAAYKIL